MTDQDDNDKRRIMTPPAEWGGSTDKEVEDWSEAATPPDSNNAEEDPYSEATVDSQSAEAILVDHQAAAQQPKAKLPVWTTVAMGAALVLLVVGGWGAISERSKLTNTVAQLENALATKSRQGDMTAAEEQILQSDNQSLRLQLESLREQYGAVAREIELLQRSVSAQIEQPTPEEALEPVAQAPATQAPAMQDSVAQVEVTRELVRDDGDSGISQSEDSASESIGVTLAPSSSDNGSWFVNVAAYSRRAMAEQWASKISDDVSTAVVSAVEVNGKALYRLRVVGIASRQDAKLVAKKLEKTYSIGPLWVGTEELTTTVTDKMAAHTPAVFDDGLDDGLDDGANSQLDNAVSNTLDTQVEAQSSQSGEGWFIYVDTYPTGGAADAKARAINNAGFNAKVSVEYRSGELFYRVQVVGITSQQEGERIAEELLSLGDMSNLQLRRY